MKCTGTSRPYSSRAYAARAGQGRTRGARRERAVAFVVVAIVIATNITAAVAIVISGRGARGPACEQSRRVPTHLLLQRVAPLPPQVPHSAAAVAPALRMVLADLRSGPRQPQLTLVHPCCDARRAVQPKRLVQVRHGGRSAARAAHEGQVPASERGSMAKATGHAADYRGAAAPAAAPAPAPAAAAAAAAAAACRGGAGGATAQPPPRDVQPSTAAVALRPRSVGVR